MDNCYLGCYDLKSVSSIPSYITSMNRTFFNCPNLSGTIHVYNQPTSYTNIFSGTTKPIYIIPHSPEIKAKWNVIASSYNNVKVLNESIVDMYCNNKGFTCTFGGYDETTEITNKIVSYLDLGCENEVYISSDSHDISIDLLSLIHDLNWQGTFTFTSVVDSTDEVISQLPELDSPTIPINQI